MRLTNAMRWRSLVSLLLVVVWCSISTAQQQQERTLLRELMLSEPSMAQARMDELKQAKAPTTCRLVIEGGSNKTELRAYGTSIARAELACTGQVIRIAVHPVLAPFAPRFTGVKVATIPNMHDLEGVEAKAKANKEACFSRRDTILYLCGEPAVEFLRPRIVNMRSQDIQQIFNGDPGDGSFGFVIQSNLAVVIIIEPFMSGLQSMIQAQGTILYVKGGLINATMGIIGTGVMLYDGTTFTHNEGLVWGGAVTIMLGHAIFKDCLFEANRARTLEDSTRGAQSIQVFRSGLGGAVLGYLLTRGNQTVPLQTSTTFVNCIFADNKAYEGGAIAVVGVNTSITNCTFKGNSAMQNGFDVFSSRGGNLQITDSNIATTSPTVAWERVNPAECLRGEFHGRMEGTCRRCPGSTYSLVTPVPAECSACPANAKCPGGDAIVAATGFFRVSNDSDKVISCPRAGACLENGTCADGHEGLVCGSCREGFAPAMPFKCVRCASKVGAVVLFVVSTLLLLVFTGIAIQLTLASNKEEADDPASHPAAGDAVKLLALFLQYTSVIGSLPVPWPPSLLALITASDWLFASSVGQTLAWVKSPFECALKGLKVPSAVLKQLVYLLMPAFVAIVQVLFFVSIYSCCCRSRKRMLHLPVVLLVSAFFTFPLVLRAAFSFFGCFRVEDPTLAQSLWWVQAMGQPCYQGAHRMWVFAVGLPYVIACCSAPLVLGLWLWRSSAMMSEPTFRARFGHLYRLYRAHAYWYEPVVLTQTILLVALAVFASQIGNYAAVLLTALHIAMALQLLQLVRPYASLLLHRLHVASLCCLLLNVFVGLLMFDQPTRPAQEGAFAIAVAGAASFSLVMSVCFIIVCCGFTCMFFFRGPGGVQVTSLLARWFDKSSERARGRRQWLTI